ncbi:unnamed protein product [Staurois parvus]|uniref:Uncharacterized protein n=1 Tax=Staurois parvus TaxID=386267 RepID=A0ABN9BA56_9NEOB|nr:unnamed protein product [Staurois parvus]
MTFPPYSGRLKQLYGSECPRTVRNRLFMTVLGLSFHTMFQPLYGRTVPELSLIVYF